MKNINKLKIVGMLTILLCLGSFIQRARADIWENGICVETKYDGKGLLIPFDVEMKFIGNNGDPLICQSTTGVLKTETNKVWVNLFDTPVTSCENWIEGSITGDGKFIILDGKKTLSAIWTVSGHMSTGHIADLCVFKNDGIEYTELHDADYKPKLSILNDNAISYLPEENIINNQPVYIGYKSYRIDGHMDEYGGTFVNDTNCVSYRIIDELNCTRQKPQLLSDDVKWIENKWLHYDMYDSACELVPMKVPVLLYENESEVLLKFTLPAFGDNSNMSVLLKGIIEDGKVRFENFQSLYWVLDSGYFLRNLLDNGWGYMNFMLNTETAVIDRPYNQNPRVIYVNAGEDLIFDYDLPNKTISNPTSGFSVFSTLYPKIASHILNPRILNTMDPTGVDDIVEAEPGIRYQNGMISSDLSKQIVVYTTDGAEIESEYTDRLDLNHLPKGVYIVRAGNNTLKIAR